MSEPCFCGRQWPHSNDEPGPPVCPVCGRDWTRAEGSEGSAFTLRCNHDVDDTCYHPGEVCDYWYSPWAHMVCGYGRSRKSRQEAEHQYVKSKNMGDWCETCMRPPSYAVHL